MEIVCQVLEIEPQRLIIPKLIQELNGRVAKPIIHIIYPTLTIGSHTKSFTLLLIIKLGNHLMILGRPWMKKHRVIIDMTNDSLVFWPGYCIHFGVTSPTILSLSSSSTETIAIKIEDNIIPKR